MIKFKNKAIYNEYKKYIAKDEIAEVEETGDVYMDKTDHLKKLSSIPSDSVVDNSGEVVTKVSIMNADNQETYAEALLDLLDTIPNNSVMYNTKIVVTTLSLEDTGANNLLNTITEGSVMKKDKSIITETSIKLEGQHELIDTSVDSGAFTLDDKNYKYGKVITFSDSDYVDLDLPSGKLWASCNLGATSPCEYGNYYAWGETTPKTDYTWDTYFDTTDDGDTFTKYNNDGGLTTLESSDDAVYVATNGEAHMPTYDDIVELYSNTDNTWCTCTVLGEGHESHTIKGRLFTSKTDNTKKIFIPAAGYQYGTGVSGAGNEFDVWSSSLPEDYSNNAWFLYSYSDGVNEDTCSRCYGFCVRGVKDTPSTKEISPLISDYNLTSDDALIIEDSVPTKVTKESLITSNDEEIKAQVESDLKATITEGKIMDPRGNVLNVADCKIIHNPDGTSLIQEANGYGLGTIPESNYFTSDIIMEGDFSD